MNKPQLSASDVLKIVKTLGKDMRANDRLCILAIRGYFRKSMGDPAKNDRGVYDDALFIVRRNGPVSPYNGNTDPSPLFRVGLASLKPGTWRFCPKKHKINSPLGYAAFGQCEAVTVVRDGKGDDTGFFGINLHKGGIFGTGSEGCQTLPPDQWESFRSAIYGVLGTSVDAVMRRPDGNPALGFNYILVTREQCEAIGVTF